MSLSAVKHWFIISLGTLVTTSPKVSDLNRDVPELYEGDMALTKEQVEALQKGRPPPSKDWDIAQTRGALRTPRMLWPNGIIPFVINEAIDAEGREMIKNSMQDWEKHVCVRFKRREQERGYIEFVYKSGCWSYVGYIGRRQEVSIGRFTKDPPCEQGALTHELGHALGFFHEQNRPDRDRYVKINWQNIRGGTEKNFEKQSLSLIDSRGVPYDLGSIMHYSKYAGNNRPGVVTIQSKDPTLDFGQRKGPSKLDIKQARLMYNCDAAARKQAARTGIGGNRQSNCITKVIRTSKHLHRVVKICRKAKSGDSTGRHNKGPPQGGPTVATEKQSFQKFEPLEIAVL